MHPILFLKYGCDKTTFEFLKSKISIFQMTLDRKTTKIKIIDLKKL